MKKSIQKDWATSLIVYVFLVVGITGIMMFFHLLDNYTKQMHEILGLAFVFAAIWHVMVNFKAMKTYFNNQRFFISGAVIASIAVAFILNANTGRSVKGLIFDSVLEGNLSKVTALLNVDNQKAIQRLKDKGFNVDNPQSLRAIAKANKTSPFEILDIMVPASQ